MIVDFSSLSLGSLALKGLLVAAAGLGAAAALRRAAAASRHGILAATALALVALPALSGLVPSLEIPIPGLERFLETSSSEGLASPPGIPHEDRPNRHHEARSPSIGVPAPDGPGSEPPVTREPGFAASQEGPESRAGTAEDLGSAASPTVVLSALPSAGTPAGAPAPDATGLASSTDPERTSFHSAAPSFEWVVPAVWALGALVSALPLVIAILRRRRLVATASPAGSDWKALGDRLRRTLGIRRPVQLLLSAQAPVAMTWGAIRPVVVLPSDAEQWTTPRRRSVLLHELAHVARGDAGFDLATRVACVVHWFDPLVWLLRARLRREAEMAADDLVLTGGRRPSLYAGHLLETARDLRRRRSAPVSAATIPFLGRAGLGERIAAILDRDRVRGRLGRGGLLLAALLTAIAVLPLAAAAPVPSDTAVAPAPPKAPDTDLSPMGAPTAPPPAAAPLPPTAPSEPSAEPSVVPSGIVGPLPTPAAAPPVPAALAPAAPRSPAEPVVIATAGTEWISETRSKDDPGPVGPFAARAAEGECEPGPFDRSGVSTRVEADDDDWNIEIRRGGCSLDIEMEGKIEFLPGDEGIERLAPGARLTILETTRGGKRRLVARSGRGGSPELEYSVDGVRVPFDPDGAEWLARVLPEVFRATGIDAEARVDWIFARGGTEAVLDEVLLIPGDFVARIYLDHLLGRERLPVPDRAKTIETAAEVLGSDFELAELLVGNADVLLEDPSLYRPWSEAVASVGSDFEARRILQPLVEKGDLNAEQLDLVFVQATEIGSDFELAELLVAAAENLPGGEELPRSYFRAAETVGSDFELRRTLQAATDRPLEADMAAALLVAARSIGSDFELAELVVSLSRALDTIPSELFDAIETIGSDFEARRALDAVVSRPDLSDETLTRALRAAESIGSDHELATLLLRVAQDRDLRGPVRDAFLRTAEGIGSSTERNRVLAELALSRGV